MSAARGHAAMLGFSALVSGSFSLGAQVAGLVDPGALMALRFLLAGVLIGVMVVAGPGFRRQYFVVPWRYLLLGGLFSVYFVLMFAGLQTASAVSTAAVFTLTPIMAAGFGWLLLRQITTRSMVLALAIGGVGALWVIFRADIGLLLAFDPGRGEVLFFIGSIAHAVYTPLSRKLNRGEPPLVFTFGIMVAGFVVLATYAGPQIIATDWAGLPARLWITLAYLVIFASAATFFLLQYATLHLPSAKVMAYTYLTPSFVILWEGALHAHWPPGRILIGVGLSILALLMLLRNR